MKKLIIGAIGLTALTVTAAAATANRSCGYNDDGTFNLGNGQVAAMGSWKDARICAMGGEEIQMDANFLRSHNKKVKEERKKREVEVHPLHNIK